MGTASGIGTGVLWLAAAGLSLAACGDDGSGPDAADTTGASSGASDGTSAPSTTDAPPATSAATADSGDSTGPGVPPDDDSSTGEPPVEGEPVFVALGDGGWIATSCDRGASWTHLQMSDVLGDHTEWTAFGGVTGGPEGFVAGFGWGAPGHLLFSANGVDWSELPARAFQIDGMTAGYDSWTAAVAHTGSQYLAFASTRWGSTDGQSWTPSGVELPPGSDQIRQLRGFPATGVLVAALESQAGNGHPVGNFIAVSDDDGVTWTEGPGYDPACGNGVQHYGDIEMSGDTIVVSASATCRSTDRGDSWGPVTTAWDGQGDTQDLFVADGTFWAIVGSRIYQSEDGDSWSEVVDTGVDLKAGASADGAFAAVSGAGDQFLYSTDGASWDAATLDWTPDGQTWVRDFAVQVQLGGCG